MRCFLKLYQPYQKTEDWLGGKKTPMSRLFFVIYRVLKTVLLYEPFILCYIPSFENSVAQSPMAHRFQLLEITGCAVPFQHWELRLQWAIK